MNKIVGAVIYTRVSTGEQDKHGTSPEMQLENCRLKALALSLPIIAEYYDPGVSGGFLLARKDFQAAIADIRAGRADTLICPNIARYSRDVEHQQAVKKAVKAAGGRLVFCDMEFADTPEGDLNFTIQGGFAEYERKVIRKRMMDGKSRHALSGKQPARAKSPFGYRIVTKADVLRGEYPAESLGRYQVIEIEAAIIREMFARYGAGASLNQVAKWLNLSGVRPGGQAKYWSASRISYILKNEVYRGLALYGQRIHRMDESRLQQINPGTGLPFKQAIVRLPGIPGAAIEIDCPPLVDDELWQQVQARLSQNQASSSGNPERVRMLAGRVVCPVCGGRMTLCGTGKNSYITTTGEKRIYTRERRYACNRSRQQYSVTGQYACSSASFMIRSVEEAVVRAIREAAQNPDAIAYAIADYREAMFQHHLAQEKQLQEKQLQERQSKPNRPSGPRSWREETREIEGAIRELEVRQTATVKAQIAGVMAGAAPEAYHDVFAEIADRRRELVERQNILERLLRQTGAGKSSFAKVEQNKDEQNKDEAKGRGLKKRPAKGKASPGWPAEKDIILQALNNAQRVLTSPKVPNSEKRLLIATLIDRVICQPDGADVVFLPGVLPVPPRADEPDTTGNGKGGISQGGISQGGISQGGDGGENGLAGEREEEIEREEENESARNRIFWTRNPDFHPHTADFHAQTANLWDTVRSNSMILA